MKYAVLFTYALLAASPSLSFAAERVYIYCTGHQHRPYQYSPEVRLSSDGKIVKYGEIGAGTATREELEVQLHPYPVTELQFGDTVVLKAVKDYGPGFGRAEILLTVQPSKYPGSFDPHRDATLVIRGYKNNELVNEDKPEWVRCDARTLD